MGLARKLDLPSRPTEKRTWSFKQMFPVASVIGKIVKTFQNPLELLLAASVTAAIVGEMVGNRVSIQFLIIVFALLVECAYERIKIKPTIGEEKHE